MPGGTARRFRPGGPAVALGSESPCASATARHARRLVPRRHRPASSRRRSRAVHRLAAAHPYTGRTPPVRMDALGPRSQGRRPPRGGRDATRKRQDWFVLAAGRWRRAAIGEAGAAGAAGRRARRVHRREVRGNASHDIGICRRARGTNPRHEAARCDSRRALSLPNRQTYAEGKAIADAKGEKPPLGDGPKAALPALVGVLARLSIMGSKPVVLGASFPSAPGQYRHLPQDA